MDSIGVEWEREGYRFSEASLIKQGWTRNELIAGGCVMIVDGVRIDWANAPKEAMFAARDSDGRWDWHACKPEAEDDVFYWSDYACGLIYEPHPDVPYRSMPLRIIERP